MNDDAIQKVLNYLDDLPEPDLYHDEDEFAFYSHARNTVLLILERILDCPFEATDDILWKFVLEMTHYSQISQSEEVKFLFDTMCEVGIDIYYVIH